ncbi:IclR family transcriptional regulator [Rhodococcus sp. HNM0569]|uniref:IclR family transcriptional regulator domain-containing protein n=1 Tax=Rhodococcus sp. HNM0569 TaxID=2716340 RepID=UPI00146CD9CA|nr:IclR family transcriptional regulator [Rhodococcus sp. HNM0569]
MTEDAPSTPVQRAFRLLEHIAAGGTTTNFSEIARATGINRVTATRLLAELENAGMVERSPGGGHRAAMPLLALAARVLADETLVSMSERALEELGRRLGLSAYLVVLDGTDAVYLRRHLPDQPLVSNITTGSRVPAHLTTPGRVLLAGLTPAERDTWLGQAPLTTVDGSPLPAAELAETLDGVAERGFDWSFSGYEAGIDSCAARVVDVGGTTVAALSVAGPSHLVGAADERRQQVRGAVTDAARALSDALRFAR